MKQLILIVILSYCTHTFADLKLDTPFSYKTDEYVLPVSYLEDIEIENSQNVLNEKGKQALAYLLADAAAQSVKLYKQTY